MSQSTEPDASTPAEEATREQVALEDAHVGTLYARLDVLRAQTAEQLADVRRTLATGTHQSRFERDAFATLYEDRLSQLWSVENRLCFGRLDLQPGTEDPRRYVGRLGLADDRGNQVLVDWRAPAAQDFYQATAAAPRDVVRRRHLLTAGRHVTGVDDEVLIAAEGERTTGDAALLAAVTAPRTGRMGDIVATIQAEQDRVIRASERGVPGPARPPWPCTGPPSCSTPTATASPAAASCCSVPARCSCATSNRSCPRWARRAW